MFVKLDGQSEMFLINFCLALPFIVETFEVRNGTHTELDEFEEIYIKGWDAKSKVEAILSL